MTEEKRSVGPITRSAGGTATTAGAAGIVLVWLIGITTGVEVPTLVASAIPVLLAASGAFLGGWLVRPGSGKRVAG